MASQHRGVFVTTAGAAVCLLGAACSATGAGATADPTFVTILEHDLDGVMTPVRAQPGIVDVNSTIDLKLDKGHLGSELQKVGGGGGTVLDDLGALDQLGQQLEVAARGLPELASALQAFADRHDAAALDQAFESFGALILPARQVIRDRPDLRAAWAAEMEAMDQPGKVDQARVTLRLAADAVRDRRTRALEAIKASGGYVRLGARLDTATASVPIHLDGFDDYARGEFHEVDRWRVALDADQKKKLEEIKTTAAQINAGGGGPEALFRSWADQLVAQLRTLLDSCAVELDDRVRAFAAKVESSPDAAQLRDDFSKLTALAQRLRAKYAPVFTHTGSSSGWLALLGDVQVDLEASRAAAAAVLGDLKKLPAIVDAATGEAKKLGQEILASKCIETITGELGFLLQKLGLARTAAELYTFGDEVLKLDLDATPEKTSFDLRYAGRREAGDGVTVQLAVGRRDGPERVVETRRLALENVLPHLETSVGLIFADPDGKAALTGRYQAAPSYSVLYKWGSRDSLAANRLLDWGIGLNLAAVDFDKDDTPELGVGGVLSLLHNYVQVGYGYDPFDDRGYWFFGVSLPLPSWALGGAANAGPAQ